MAEIMKHTPGPWQIERKGPLIIKSIGPCEPDEYAGAAWLEVSEADALLIAAAPDLLEALRDSLIMLARLKRHCRIVDNAGYTPDGRMLSLTCVEDAANAAIAKAEGRT